MHQGQAVAREGAVACEAATVALRSEVRVRA